MTRAVSIGLALALGLAAALGGCHNNEESFYIEHLKALPDPPDCKVSTGDPVIPEITVDLALAGSYDFYAWFQVTNALMEREDYDNLKAESNGIFVDESQSTVSIGGQTGGGESREVNIYIAPETTAVIPGITISAQAFQDLAASMGCAPVWETGAVVHADIAADGTLDNLPESLSLGTGYGNIRFVGHTQGGTEVETNRFSFAISLCCNCYVDWGEVVDPCTAFCEDITDYTSCAPGVNAGSNPYPGHNVTHDPSAEWDGTNTADAGTDCELDC